MRIYRLHDYNVPCDFPHTTFRADLEKAWEIHEDRQRLNQFVNAHSTEYLHNLIKSHEPLLLVMLANDRRERSGKGLYGRAITHFFNEIDQRRRERRAEQQRKEAEAHGIPTENVLAQEARTLRAEPAANPDRHEYKH